MFTDLKDYGFTQSDFLASQELLNDKNPEEFLPGRVIECRRERYKVISGYGELNAELKGSFLHSLEEGDLFPVVGDFVISGTTVWDLP